MNEKRLSRSQAIRAKCLDCCAGQSKEVKLCHLKDCPLWKYRFGYEIDDKGKRITRTRNTQKNVL